MMQEDASCVALEKQDLIGFKASFCVSVCVSFDHDSVEITKRVVTFQKKYSLIFTYTTETGWWFPIFSIFTPKIGVS